MRAFFWAGVICLTASAACAESLRIMPLGDSITTGTDDNNLTPGGYRTALYDLLHDAGYDFNFVGSMTDNPGPIPDNEHEGHVGFQLNQLRAVIGLPMQQYQPDIVLLLAGSNDVTFATKIDPSLTVGDIADRLDALLSDIYQDRPTATVFVGTILAAAESQDGLQHTAFGAEVNAAFPGVLATHEALGQHVHLVDLSSMLTPSDLADSLHPSPAGYVKLGYGWFDAIESVFPPFVPPPPALAGDANGDGVVNIFDINLISAHWGEAGIYGDANHDGIVNIFDVNTISANWGATNPNGAHAVPAPNGMALAMIALSCGLAATGANLQRAKSGRQPNSRIVSGGTADHQTADHQQAT